MWSRALVTGVLILVVAGACASDEPEEEAAEPEEEAADADVTTTTAEEPAGDAEEPTDEPGGASTCDDDAEDVFVDQEPGSAPEHRFLDLTRVELDDRGDEIGVRWHVAAAVPTRATWENGEVGSNLWAAQVVPEGDSLGYGLHVDQIGGDWVIEIVDWEQSAERMEVGRPSDARLSEDVLAAEFPAESMERLGPGTAWYAVTEGDGPLDTEFDVALPRTVQDRCPEADSVSSPSGATVALR